MAVMTLVIRVCRWHCTLVPCWQRERAISPSSSCTLFRGSGGGGISSPLLSKFFLYFHPNEGKNGFGCRQERWSDIDTRASSQRKNYLREINRVQGPRGRSVRSSIAGYIVSQSISGLPVARDSCQTTTLATRPHARCYNLTIANVLFFIGPTIFNENRNFFAILRAWDAIKICALLYAIKPVI